MIFFHLSAASILEVRGKDSLRYTNARLSNDISSLDLNHGCLAAALSAQGRTQALFSVYLLEKDRYLLICDQGDPKELSAVFSEFIVADQLEVNDLSADYKLFHIIAEQDFELVSSQLGLNTAPSGEFTLIRSDKGLVAVRKRSPAMGFDALVTQDNLEAFQQQLADQAAQEIDRKQSTYLRLQAGIPVFPAELNSKTLFSESDLRQAISSTKGCYIGQEVITKVDTHGKTARVLRRLVLEGCQDLAAGTSVYSQSEEKLGEIVTSACGDQQTLCFARIKTEAAQNGLPVLTGKLKGKID